MMESFAANLFEVPPGENGPLRVGLFVLLSRFNHSCEPNAKVPTLESDKRCIVATRDLKAGEEITRTYETWFVCWTSFERSPVL